jgi:hypothetical protein
MRVLNRIRQQLGRESYDFIVRTRDLGKIAKRIEIEPEYASVRICACFQLIDISRSSSSLKECPDCSNDESPHSAAPSLSCIPFPDAERAPQRTTLLAMAIVMVDSYLFPFQRRPARSQGRN